MTIVFPPFYDNACRASQLDLVHNRYPRESIEPFIIIISKEVSLFLKYYDLAIYNISNPYVHCKSSSQRTTFYFIDPNHHSHPFPNTSAIFSNHTLSSSPKPPTTVQSISMIALTTPSTTIGITISLLLSESQAICPGNFSTSSMIWVSCVLAARPQTPREKAMV